MSESAPISILRASGYITIDRSIGISVSGQQCAGERPNNVVVDKCAYLGNKYVRRICSFSQARLLRAPRHGIKACMDLYLLCRIASTQVENGYF